MPSSGSTQQSLSQHQRARVKQLLDTDKIDGALWRGLVKIMLDEFNNHADKHNAILNAVDAATSLADLKTRVAAIPDYPQRTPAQIIKALKGELGVE
jgi:hypothetical protein